MMMLITTIAMVTIRIPRVTIMTWLSLRMMIIMITITTGDVNMMVK